MVWTGAREKHGKYLYFDGFIKMEMDYFLSYYCL